MSADADKPVILLVEDAPANIHIAQSILKDDYRIRVATSGAKALELVKAEPVPELILLDVEMPEMDGYEVCGRLKTDPQTRGHSGDFSYGPRRKPNPKPRDSKWERLTTFISRSRLLW